MNPDGVSVGPAHLPAQVRPVRRDREQADHGVDLVAGCR